MALNEVKKYYKVTMLLLFVLATYLVLFILFIREEWQENEILNVAVMAYPSYNAQPKEFNISVFADGSLHVAVGLHDYETIWRNSMQLGYFGNRAWHDLNRRGYWQIIWRGSVQLRIVYWEERFQLNEEDFERIKELVQAVDRRRLSGEFALAHTANFLINTRRTRYYAQDLPGSEDERAIKLLRELVRLMPDAFYNAVESEYDLDNHKLS